MKKIILVACLLFLSALNLMAQEQIFNYTYQSNILNKGQKELEVWTTVLSGKEKYYREIQNRVGYEVGLCSNLQISFYLNSEQKAAFDDVTGEIVIEAPEISVSNGWKHKFSDPIADPIGCAGYVEFTVTMDEIVVRVKAIFDKKIRRSTHAWNITFKEGWKSIIENGEAEVGKEIKYDFNYGYSYNLNKNWNLGVEIINKNTYIEEDDYSHSALFAGPTLGFNMDNFWLNASVFPQISGLNTSSTNSALNLDEFTKINSRLMFSYSF